MHMGLAMSFKGKCAIAPSWVVFSNKGNSSSTQNPFI